jgi:hypothetical protein
MRPGEAEGKDDNHALSTRLEQVGQELDWEVISVTRLLKQHLEVSASHSEALIKVSKNLCNRGKGGQSAPYSGMSGLIIAAVTIAILCIAALIAGGIPN